MRLKSREVFNKGREQFGLGLLFKKRWLRKYFDRNVYENLIQMPNIGLWHYSQTLDQPEAVFLVMCDPFYEQAVSNLDRPIHRSLWV
jgi:hypothetical protein